MSNTNRILVKLAPSVSLAAADPRANLRPLYDTVTPAGGFGLTGSPTSAWHLADLPDGAATPWDMAHAQLADQLGIDESAILFAEPDLLQEFELPTPTKDDLKFALGPNCDVDHQDNSLGRATGPKEFAWHLGDEYTQLRLAREAVEFREPRTRIAHIDTGYDRTHVARPENILDKLERNFVDGDNRPTSALDPNRGHASPDNSGHGTGTIGILAGGKIAQCGDTYLGGAPHAEILPLRISNSVILGVFYASTFAQALQYAIQQNCDVVSISMGGRPSKAWNEAVNAAYEAGICIVAAAGNNVRGVLTRHVVYPARYHRTIAVCGVMADGKPYDNIGGTGLEGNFGPDSCMTAALTTYTPNIPWAVFGGKDVIRLNGEGTSAATPQIAAAVALWFEKYKDVLPRDWHRVEAVRKALFDSARKSDPTHFGNGILRANEALAKEPDLTLQKTPPDNDSFSIFRVITGLGITDAPPRENMFNLELAQRWLVNAALQEIIPDPEKDVSEKDRRRFMEAVIEDEETSITLRKHIADRYPLLFKGESIPNPPETVVPPPKPACASEVSPSDPPYRRIRAYAMDPSFSTRLDSASINEAVLKVRWEELERGPKGEYLEVVDKDPAGKTYKAIDLDDPKLLAQNGYAPAEGNPAFHQQMVYAVAMTTIAHFERALGRPVLWRPKINTANEFDDSQFVRQLKVEPHALRQANAFYSPQLPGLRFGYFQASANDPGDHVPGSMVYSCLSHDIVAHETTHAILDGMHRRFNEPTNPDVLAFHEGFADIVALMQHFTMPEILEFEIGRTRGNLQAESILGSLAVQFGSAIGGRGALRQAIGKIDNNGAWTRLKPNPADYQTQLAPHSRGAILVSAVFDAFLAIYERRTVDLLRIYTGGTGVLPSGAIHPDLVNRLANEASKSARHILNMCIRALDYIPPVDITFGEYLRGIITADFDLIEDDKFNYRVAFVEAFRRRGIYPRDLDTLSVDTLRWDGVPISEFPPQYEFIIEQLKQYADACFYIDDREKLFVETRNQRQRLHGILQTLFKESPTFAEKLGLDSTLDKFEVHGLNRASRIGPDGQYIPQIVLALTQSRDIEVQVSGDPQKFRGGSTLIVDLSKPAIQYAIIKRINSPARQERIAAFQRDALQDPLKALLITPNQQEPFAALHILSGTYIESAY